jgi:hypothetical protein
MSVNQELQKLQTKIGNSFLRAFYPIDYRSNQNMLKNIDDLLEREARGLRSLAATTSQVSQKIGRTLDMMSKEIDALQDSLDSVQAKSQAGDDLIGRNASNAEMVSNALIDMLVAGGFEAVRAARGRGGSGKSKALTAAEKEAARKAKIDKWRSKKTGEATPPKGGGKYNLPKGLTILALAWELWNVWSELQALDPNMKKGEYRQAVAQIVARAVASFGLMWVGAFLGAMVGGALGFGVGAIPGFIAGLIGGTIADYALGDTVDTIVNKVVDYLYTGEEEEEEAAAASTGSDSTMSMKEAPAPTPSLEPVQQQVSEQVSATVPLAAPLVGPTPPTPPAEQTVDAPVEYPGPVAPVDLEPFKRQEPSGREGQNAVDEALNKANTAIPDTAVTQAAYTQRIYGPNGGPQTSPGPLDNAAEFDTSSDQAGGITPQETATGDVRVNFQLAGKNRPGMPNSGVLNLVKKSAAAVGMTSITVTSGRGSYISPGGKARGQKTTVHATGDAVDVVGFASQQQKIDFARAARSMGAGGIGVYNNGSLHIDTGRPRHWNWGDSSFPAIAEGGRVSEPTLALIGEGGEPEYVVPQSKAIKFAHEMIAARPQTRTKKHTHVVVVPILT